MLREPQKGQALTADWGISIVRALRKQRVIEGLGIRVTGGPNGVIISVIPQNTPPSRPGASGGYPRPFDISMADGQVVISNLYYQVGDVVKSAVGTLQTALPGSASVLYVLLPTTNNGQLQLAYDANTMGGLFFPVALYRLGATGEVLLDMRGSQIVMYK